jgi:hypothetical protein
MVMSTNPLIDIPSTQYYFDTFVIGAHHSVPHMIADLLRRKELAEIAINNESLKYKIKEYRKLIDMIDAKLSNHNINELNDLELAEPSYWVNELTRRVAIEVNTYGRVRPETMDLLLCVEEEDFGTIMKNASGITNRIKMISDFAEKMAAPVPPTMPRQG